MKHRMFLIRHRNFLTRNQILSNFNDHCLRLTVFDIMSLYFKKTTCTGI